MTWMRGAFLILASIAVTFSKDFPDEPMLVLTWAILLAAAMVVWQMGRGP